MKSRIAYAILGKIAQFWSQNKYIQALIYGRHASKAFIYADLVNRGSGDTDLLLTSCSFNTIMPLKQTSQELRLYSLQRLALMLNSINGGLCLTDGCIQSTCCRPGKLNDVVNAVPIGYSLVHRASGLLQRLAIPSGIAGAAACCCFECSDLFDNNYRNLK